MKKELKELKLSELVPYLNNPRNNDDAVEDVKESIRQCEYIAPIIVDENMVILAGHTRYKALKELGKTSAEVLIATGLTEEQKKKYRLLDNKTNERAEWNFNLLDAELQEAGFGGYDFGFDALTPDSEEWGTDFELPDGEKNEICQITFYLHEEQKGLIEYAMSLVEDEVHETFGNKNKHGNEIYEVVRQWAEQRK